MMNLVLKHKGYEDNLIELNPSHGGIQYLFKFDNDYGASVIKHNGSYGCEKDLWELAVLTFRGDNWDITCDTDITCDVEGYLTDEEVCNLLEEIKGL